MPHAKPKRTHLWMLLGIMTVGLILRVIWVSRVDTQPVTDFAWYLQKAVQISQGEGYHHQGVSTAYWPVGWPAALGFFFRLAPATLASAKLLTTLLTWLAIPLTYLLGRKLFSREESALLGAGIIAIHPHFIAYSSILASEPLFTCLTLGFFILQVEAVRKPLHAVLSGLLLGLACFVRPQALLLPCLVRLFSWKQEKQSRSMAWISVGLCLVVCLGVLSPWLLHTKAIFGRFVFVSANGGDNLLIGHHPGAKGRYRNPDECGLVRPPDMSESERDQAALRQALANIRQDPFLSIRLIPAKLSETLFTTTDAAYWAFQLDPSGLQSAGITDPAFFRWFRALSQWSQWSLLCLSALGLARLILARRTASLPILLSGLGLPLILSVVFFGNPRFFFAAIPLCALLAGALVFLPPIDPVPQPKAAGEEAV